jgi:hypothetical protein
MIALHLLALCLQVRVNGRDTGGQSLVSWNKENVRVVIGEWLNVVNRRQGAQSSINFASTNPFTTRSTSASGRFADGSLIGMAEV